ncbi:MAG: aldehyde dehydrogenase, partial [Bdellovibrionales bacterium]|nr:aldehyde dehydrogenase [Bdellovibrionales bacterium]
FETYATEIGFIFEEINYTLKHLESWSKVKKVKTPFTLFPGKSFIHPEPYGVVLIISPWNYPFQLCLSPFIGAIAAGNRVVVKPSEFATETSSIIKKILNEVFKENEVVVVEGALEETQTLLNQKFDYIFFTGSTGVGKIIMKAAAEHLTPVTLELGGKSPCLIEESANIDIAAKRVAWGKFLNAGQTCVAPDYILIPKSLQDQFIERLKHYITTFYGQDVKSSNDYPRIVNNRHFDRLKDLLLEPKIAIGGELNRSENFIGPTVMKDVEWSDKIMQDEIFGPILPIIPYDQLEDAIKNILNYPKPLAFYLFTEDSQKQKEIISLVPFGGGCVNDTVIHLANPNLPFGGVGTSGIGSYHGQKSFDTFTHYKSLYQQGTLVDIPLRYPPYNEQKMNWIKFFLR